MDKWLNIAARTLTIIAIAFISLFALDSFDPAFSLQRQILAFLIHLIPSFVLMAVLAVSWRWPIIGGALLVIAGCLPFVLLRNEAWVNIMLGSPFIIAGALFIAGALISKPTAQS